MRLETCKQFDAEKFIKKLKRWDEKKEKLQDALDSISELSTSANNTGRRGTDISDPTSAKAIKKLRLKEEIEDIERCQAAFEYGMSRLTEEEREIINGFFFPKMPIWKFVRKWQDEHYVGSTLVYKARREALEKLGEIIESRYEL